MTARKTKYDIVDELINKSESDFDLSSKQANSLVAFLGEMLTGIHQRKRGYVYTHNRIVSELGAWYEYFDYSVSYEVPFSVGNFNSENVRFDIVAEKGKETAIIEVKDMMNKKDFGQINYYANMLQKTKIKAKLYLAIDFLELDDAQNDETAMGDMVKEIMEREKVGLIFVDKDILLICNNYEQLRLIKMPELYLYTEEE